MKFEELPEFVRDTRRLLKKYRTLESDLMDVRKDLADAPLAHQPFSFRISGLKIDAYVVKVKRIASDSFKGSGSRSGFRLIYAYFEEEQKIVFIEIYHKNEQPNEDRHRILRYFGGT